MRLRLLILSAIAAFFLLSTYHLLPRRNDNAASPAAAAAGGHAEIHIPSPILHGEAIMPHLGNETAKAELGRAAWKLLHTTLARYPSTPSASERTALSSYLYLFARLYPCGECAAHFQKLLQQYPPQTSSREAASAWGCFLHNQVNARLGKGEFDCKLLGEVYKCGCADEEVGEGDTLEKNVRAARGRVEIERAPENMRGG
ncbi:putative FAD dependent sulfhydryl oxidase Erv2 [Sphaerosporella brunnea]|uniref:Sulfhydryl oxidase n=1 Tax=Sphaerosporella brunnea TaxID=1250544 RepID=A0A5J5ERM8_9PEZI|nr:putative FAD dependent sulfhydryl oxidase Erv2 [Sphaerosporella brunnea]